jgi:tetratricopeptide (TPR) repeat protein
MNKEQLTSSLQQAFAQADWVQAEQLAQQALENFPDEAFGYAYYAQWLQQQSQPDYGILERVLGKALDLQPEDLSLWRSYAQACEQTGNWEQAAAAYHSILDHQAQDIEALLALGQYHTNIGKQYDWAFYYFNTALSLDPTQKDAYIYRGKAYLDQGQYAEALADLDYGLYEHFNATGLLLKIEVLTKLERPDEADIAYETLIEQQAEEPSYRYDYGLHLFKRGQVAYAAEQFEAGLQHCDKEHPLFFHLSEQLGRALFAAGAYAQAIKPLDAALSIHLDQRELWELSAQCHLMTGNPMLALADADQALGLAQGQAFLENSVKAIKAEALIGIGQVEEARNLLQELGQDPLFKGDALYGQAHIALQAGQTEQAYALLEQAYGHSPEKVRRFVQQQLQSHLQSQRAKQEQAHAAETSKNSQSKVLQAIFGQIWTIDNLKNARIQDLKTLPLPVQENMQKLFKQHFMVFTPSEALFLLPNFDDSPSRLVKMFSYKIQGEKDNLIQLQLSGWDGQQKLVLKLRVDNPEQLTLSKADQEQFTLKKQSPLTLPGIMRQAFQQQCWAFPTEGLSPEMQKVLQAFV